MKTFIVLVDALGHASGCSRKGELVTEEQVGAENVARLVASNVIMPQGGEPQAPEAPDEPASGTIGGGASLAQRIALGIVPVEGTLTDEEAAWVANVKAGVEELPFDEKAIMALTNKEIKEKIESFGVEPMKDGTKVKYAAQLKDAIVAYFEGWETEPSDEAPADDEEKSTEEAEAD